MKPRYDTTQLKSHPKRNRKQNELVKAMLKQLDLMLGENHAGELLAVFVDLLKRAVNETPDGRLELRSVEVTLNDYFHAKNLADGAQFKIDEDHKKLKAFEVIRDFVKDMMKHVDIIPPRQGGGTKVLVSSEDFEYIYECKNQEEADLFGEALK